MFVCLFVGGQDVNYMTCLYVVIHTDTVTAKQKVFGMVFSFL